MVTTHPNTLSGATLPPRVRDLPNPPDRLRLVGELPRGPSVAIVGTRAPTPEAKDFTRRLASKLARAGVAILSGGAHGIDAAAHLGSLDAGGVTVVVAPAGWERPYPEDHAGLFSRIVAEGGAYVSLVDSGDPANCGQFFPRNGLLAALSHAVVVVQAGFRSGARNTAAQARRLRRPLFAVPSSPWIVEGRGCNLEIGRGARILNSSGQIIACLAEQGLVPIPSLSPQIALTFGPCRSSQSLGEGADASEGLPTAHQAILRAISAGAKCLDEICLATGLNPAFIQEGILQLTLNGLVRQGYAGELVSVTTCNQ